MNSKFLTTAQVRSLLIGTLVSLLAVAYYLWRNIRVDGMNASGVYDDEGGSLDQFHYSMTGKTYAQNPVTLRHFNIDEFDSPDVPGSGSNMQVDFLVMLDEGRERAGIVFKVSRGGGYRTDWYNASLYIKGSVKNSSHKRGYAADISARTLEEKIRIIRALRSVGFRRFGIYKTFIHVDSDPNKGQDLAWNDVKAVTNKGEDFIAAGFPFDPFTV